ncbi:C45 family autoproteolytic acyltransferase/hydolase [Dokdonia sp.]|uniref:C45 family autoproteolytic acyltransferase/hydolase n=1 Tax=Dokdonia sp. TaxID=2024995 RepID=UPI0032662E51
MVNVIKTLIAVLVFCCFSKATACSIVYYVDPDTGKIYVVNNEDFWYNTDAYIQIIPETKNELARLWYGWNDFGQGGINSAGLFFDVAVTPNQKVPKGYRLPEGNITDRILAHCRTVDEVLAYMEKEKMALNQSHMLIGDAQGNAIIVEWVDGKKHVIKKEGNSLIATNYLLLKPEAGNYPCPRYASIEERIKEMESSGDPITLPSMSAIVTQAYQTPRTLDNGKTLGTLYTSFIDITEMKMVFLPKLDSKKVMQFDLREEFKSKRKITLF